MAVVALVSALVWTGVLPALQPAFSRAETGPESITVACPPADATPLPYDQVTANVYNGSGEEGLAGTTADALRANGISVGTVGNWPDSAPVPAMIVAGDDGLTQAYTLARLVPESVVTTDDRDGTAVDLVLGKAGTPPLTPDAAAALTTGEPFIAPQGCV